MLELATVVEGLLVFGLDGCDAGFVILAAGFEVLVYLAELGFRCFFASELDFEIRDLLCVSRRRVKRETETNLFQENRNLATLLVIENVRLCDNLAHFFRS